MKQFNGVKVFSATLARDREDLGEKVTHWLRAHEGAEVLERRLWEITGLGRIGIATLFYLTAVALPVALLAVFARGDRKRMALYGYALIPLDLGAHAAHNLLHLLGEGESVWWVTASLLGLSSPLDIPGGHPGGSMGA